MVDMPPWITLQVLGNAVELLKELLGFAYVTNETFASILLWAKRFARFWEQLGLHIKT